MYLNYSISKQLIRNVQPFLNIRHYSLLDSLLCRCGTFYGWGYKRSGQKAVELAKKCQTLFILLEDGFIRSIDLGLNHSPSFSIVEDDIGIYYDATTPSRLENILNLYDFQNNIGLINDAKKAIKLLKKHKISKYNNAPLVDDIFLNKYKFKMQKNVLIIAQTAGDASLKYGMLEPFTTDEIMEAAIDENPDAKVFIKIHPDVLSGKKKSDIDINNLDPRVQVITENVNPISLLEYFDTVYTKTSQMGFEAILVGKKCVCFGMPFYAGWGVTDDRVRCDRRKKKLGTEEIFAGAYILYTRYYNPYQKRPSDIFDTIDEIIKQKKVI